MIRNDTNKCIYTNNDIKCLIIPTYGIQGEKAKYCFEHSKLFENKRFMEIFNDLGNRLMYLIRFNPDKYYNKKKSLLNHVGVLVKMD